MKYDKINKSLFRKNRDLFKKQMDKNTIAVFNSNDVMPTNADGTMPFCQNSDLFWLTGVNQEESVLIICNGCRDEKDLLFLKETNDHIAIWEGDKLSKKDAYNISDISNIYWLDEFQKKLKELIDNCDGIYLNKNMHSRHTSKVETRDERFRKKLIKVTFCRF